MNKLGLYVHIPFCRKICYYCDFYKMRAKPITKTQYIDTLCQEIDIQKKKIIEPFQTIYLGGGTPSSLELQDLERLLQKLNEWVIISSLQEATIEINPEDINEDLLEILVKHHITRLSLGIQRFGQETSSYTNRHYEFEDMEEKVALIHSFGFTNLNFDFMYGFPGDTVELVLKDLDQFLRLNPKHLSCYSLILEPKTIIFNRFQKGEFHPLSDEIEADCYYAIRDKLIKLGYIHYETSNFALPGYESLHNLIYWSDERYLGIGAGSSSYHGNKRTKTVSNIKCYRENIEKGTIPYEEEVTITPEEEQKEVIMLGLRKTKGISLSEFQKRYQRSLLDAFPNISPLLENGTLLLEGDFLHIAPDKLYLANYILRKIL